MGTTTLTRAEYDHARRGFLRHLGEMTAAMLVGMFAFGALLGLTAGLAGSSMESVRLTQPELFMTGMVVAMSLTMVAWMRHRHHTWRHGGEMSAAMALPVLGVLVCYWAGAISAGPICPVSCVLMIPAMAVAMSCRRDLYSRLHPS